LYQLKNGYFERVIIQWIPFVRGLLSPSSFSLCIGLMEKPISVKKILDKFSDMAIYVNICKNKLIPRK
jgi:hypothetical protein